jgi:hypothetical protein
MSGREDLNLRPVAAATALPQPIKFVSTSSGLVVSLALLRFGSTSKAFAVNKHPGSAVFRCLGIPSVMPTNSLGYILARAHVASSSFLASQHVTIKHCSVLEDSCRGERI